MVTLFPPLSYIVWCLILLHWSTIKHEPNGVLLKALPVTVCCYQLLKWSVPLDFEMYHRATGLEEKRGNGAGKESKNLKRRHDSSSL